MKYLPASSVNSALNLYFVCQLLATCYLSLVTSIPFLQSTRPMLVGCGNGNEALCSEQSLAGN